MKKVFLLSALGVLVVAGPSWATTVLPGSEASLQSLLAGEGYSIDVNADQVLLDHYWHVSEGTKSGSWSTLLFEIAGNKNVNTFGIFDNSGHSLQLFSGASDPEDKVAISWSSTGLLSAQLWDYNNLGDLQSISSLAFNIDFDQVFGYYLGTPDGPFYSDPDMNADDADQMVSYRGTGVNGLSVGHYVIAWEDLAYGGSDKDFNDMVLLVESVQPIPEPATMLLFGAGLAGLAGARRRMKK